VMSGTPTVGTDSYLELQQLYSLFQFLRHPQYGLDAAKGWQRSAFKTACMRYLQGTPEGLDDLTTILSNVMVRHTNRHLDLKPPVFKEHHAVLPSECPSIVQQYFHQCDIQEEEERNKKQERLSATSFETWEARQAAQRADERYAARDGYYKALHIQNVICQARKHGHVKAIVFGENWVDLNYTGHWLTLLMGSEEVTQHHAGMASASIQSFRSSKKACVKCPHCGNFEDVIDGKPPRCSRTILKVRWHGVRGDGIQGYLSEQMDHAFDHRLEFNANPQPQMLERGTALVEADRVEGLLLGRQFQLGDIVQIIGGKLEGCELAAAGGTPSGSAVVLEWRPCFQYTKGFRPSRNTLLGEPRQVVHSPSTVLLLEKTGSHGLDLNFVTHMFLLPGKGAHGAADTYPPVWRQMDDPALINQIVARAHRIGHAKMGQSKAAVEVTTIIFYENSAKCEQADVNLSGKLKELWEQSW